MTYIKVVTTSVQVLLTMFIGWLLAHFKVLDGPETARKMNEFVLKVSAPCLGLWLIALKTDMRNPEYWRLIWVFMVWNTVLEILVGIYVRVACRTKRASMFGLHSLVLSFNSTGIIGLVITQAILGPSVASLGLIISIPMFMQQIVLSMFCFEWDRRKQQQKEQLPSRQHHADKLEKDSLPCNLKHGQHKSLECSKEQNSPPCSMRNTPPQHSAQHTSSQRSTQYVPSQNSTQCITMQGTAMDEAFVAGPGASHHSAPQFAAPAMLELAKQQFTLQFLEPGRHLVSQGHLEAQPEDHQGLEVIDDGSHKEREAAFMQNAAGLMVERRLDNNGFSQMSHNDSQRSLAATERSSGTSAISCIPVGFGAAMAGSSSSSFNSLQAGSGGDGMEASATACSGYKLEGGTLDYEENKLGGSTLDYESNKLGGNTLDYEENKLGGNTLDCEENNLGENTLDCEENNLGGNFSKFDEIIRGENATGRNVHGCHLLTEFEFQHEDPRENVEKRTQEGLCGKEDDYGGKLLIAGKEEQAPVRALDGWFGRSTSKYKKNLKGFWSASFGRIRAFDKKGGAGISHGSSALAEQLKHIFLVVVTNPLLMSTILSVVLSLAGLPTYLDPARETFISELGFIEATLAWLGNTTAPLSMFAQGLWLHGKLRQVASQPTKVAAYMSVKLFIGPTLMLLLTRFCGLEGRYSVGLIIMTAVPVSQIAWVLGEQYQLGAEAMTAVMLVGIVTMLPHTLVLLQIIDSMHLFNYK